MPQFQDAFTLRVAAATIDADVDIGDVGVMQDGSSYHYTAPFTYVTGTPAATAFHPSLTEQPDGELARSGVDPTVTPNAPVGRGSQIRTGTLSGTVSPSVTTDYTIRLLIQQA